MPPTKIKFTTATLRKCRKGVLNTQQRRNWRRAMRRIPSLELAEEFIYNQDPRCPVIPRILP